MRTSFSSDSPTRPTTSKMMANCTSQNRPTSKQRKSRRKIRWMSKKSSKKDYRKKRRLARPPPSLRQNQALRKILLSSRHQSRKERRPRRETSTAMKTITREITEQGRKEGRGRQRRQEEEKAIRETRRQDHEENRGEEQPIHLKYNRSRGKLLFWKILSRKRAHKDSRLQEGRLKSCRCLFQTLFPSIPTGGWPKNSSRTGILRMLRCGSRA